MMMAETDSDCKIRVVDGDVVGVTYKGTLDDGEVFDQNEGALPHVAILLDSMGIIHLDPGWSTYPLPPNFARG